MLSKKDITCIHNMDITQIIALTNHENRLMFVTTSLDCLCKIVEVEEMDQEFNLSIEHEILANGSVLNGVSLHGATCQFAVSTYNEETEQSFVQVYRRKSLRSTIGPFACTIADLKSFWGVRDSLCIPDPEDGGKNLILIEV